MWPKLLHSTERYASTSQISYNLKLQDHSTITLTMIQEGVLPPAGSPTQKIETVVVDPAGLKFIGESVAGARGASEAIYDHFGITRLSNNGVRVAEAWLGKYEKGKVIHVVSPDLTDLTSEKAIACLTDAYYNVFQASLSYARTLVHTLLVLRLLPISSGINGTRFTGGNIHKITWRAVTNALRLMDGEMGKRVQVLFCILSRSQ